MMHIVLLYVAKRPGPLSMHSDNSHMEFPIFMAVFTPDRVISVDVPGFPD